ncbi:hypothetical protein TH63_06840 [Rufibacter radiotolerans]|uniref:Uncharacterized protein n=1 Tax=Rufibacter radiotolerans TaxID=1379910 RepID=A0A0H4VJ59_9BACT|nr:hypothetical protein TH63_06840 [Rufibacter radiotolerans]
MVYQNPGPDRNTLSVVNTKDFLLMRACLNLSFALQKAMARTSVHGFEHHSAAILFKNRFRRTSLLSFCLQNQKINKLL